jgi:hypothetical protein
MAKRKVKKTSLITIEIHKEKKVRKKKGKIRLFPKTKPQDTWLFKNFVK